MKEHECPNCGAELTLLAENERLRELLGEWLSLAWPAIPKGVNLEERTREALRRLNKLKGHQIECTPPNPGFSSSSRECVDGVSGV